MKITKVKVFYLKKESNLKAFAGITFDNSFVVEGFKVMDGSKGLFVSMPSRKDNKGAYQDTAFPITKEFRQELIDAILAEFNKGYEEKGFVDINDDDEDLPF